MMPTSEVLATIHATSVRRMFGVGVLAVLGGSAVYIAFVRPPESFGWQIILLAFGALTLGVADKMRRATEMTLELTETELRDSTGRVLALISEISAVDRSLFAFKPSNGFIVKTRSRQKPIWAPGVFWRIGKYLGIGGVTSVRETKFMSDALSALIAERESRK